MSWCYVYSGMWSRAVWVEKDGEEDGVIPTSWIKGNHVYWPTVVVLWMLPKH